MKQNFIHPEQTIVCEKQLFYKHMKNIYMKQILRTHGTKFYAHRIKTCTIGTTNICIHRTKSGKK
jgi:hypothetical protein